MRIDSKGGSRVVACPVCEAGANQFCRDGRKVRTQSHPARVGKAYERQSKLDAKKRMTAAQTYGARVFLGAMLGLSSSSLLLDFEASEGFCLLREACSDAADRFLRARSKQ